MPGVGRVKPVHVAPVGPLEREGESVLLVKGRAELTPRGGEAVKAVVRRFGWRVVEFVSGRPEPLGLMTFKRGVSCRSNDAPPSVLGVRCSESSSSDDSLSSVSVSPSVASGSIVSLPAYERSRGSVRILRSVADGAGSRRDAGNPDSIEEEGEAGVADERVVGSSGRVEVDATEADSGRLERDKLKFRFRGAAGNVAVAFNEAATLPLGVCDESFSS